MQQFPPAEEKALAMFMSNWGCGLEKEIYTTYHVTLSSEGSQVIYWAITGFIGFWNVILSVIMHLIGHKNETE